MARMLVLFLEREVSGGLLSFRVNAEARNVPVLFVVRILLLKVHVARHLHGHRLGDLVGAADVILDEGEKL